MEHERKLFNFSEYTDIFKHVNSFGRYQKKVAYGLCLIFVGQGLMFGHFKFVVATPKFQCSTPNVSCGGINKCCTNCTSYEFDPLFTTVVSEWNLICDRSYLAAIIQSLFFAGMLVGSLLSGILSDAFGRKTVLFASLGSMAISGVVQSFVSSSIGLYAFLRFATGAFLISATLSTYILMLEITGPDHRARMGNVNMIFYSVGDFLQVLVGYFINDWRTYVWVSSVPGFLLYFFWWAIPESPRWLVVKGKLKQAQHIILKYGGKDNKPCDPEQVMTMLRSIHQHQIQRSSNVKRYTPLDLVRTPKLRKWTIITCFAWFTTSFVYFALFIYTSQLQGNLYVITLVYASLSCVLVLPTWFSMYSLGRRVTQCILMVMTGVLLLLILTFPKGYSTTTTYLAVAGILSISQCWSSVYLISSELFPTVLRQTAQGVGSTAARVGGIAAPFLLMLAQLPGSSIILPMVIFGSCAIACGIVSLWLPETASRPLYQTTIEAEEKPVDYGIPCIRKRNRIVEADMSFDTAL